VLVCVCQFREEFKPLRPDEPGPLDSRGRLSPHEHLGPIRVIYHLHMGVAAFGTLLQAEALAHQALQAGFVEEVVGQLFVRKHGEGGALGSGVEF
jgi:hypothetical protein